MMQDVFIEYMVKRQRTPKVFFLKLGIVLLGGVLAFICFVFAYMLGPFSIFGVALTFGVLYGSYFLITGFNVEYEYSLTNGEMDIDKITAQRRRKRLLTMKLREVEDFGRYSSKDHEGKTYQNKLIACDHPDADDLWFAITRMKDKGTTLVVFNASPKMVEGFKPYLPRPIYHRVYQTR